MTKLPPQSPSSPPCLWSETETHYRQRAGCMQEPHLLIKQERRVFTGRRSHVRMKETQQAPGGDQPSVEFMNNGGIEGFSLCSSKRTKCWVEMIWLYKNLLKTRVTQNFLFYFCSPLAWSLPLVHWSFWWRQVPSHMVFIKRHKSKHFHIDCFSPSEKSMICEMIFSLREITEHCLRAWKMNCASVSFYVIVTTPSSYWSVKAGVEICTNMWIIVRDFHPIWDKKIFVH